MPHFLSAYLALPFLVFLFLFIVHYIFRGQNSPEITAHCSVTSIHALLNPPYATEHELLTSRAAPNKRLVDAFHLSNTFVSPEPHIHRAFVAHARGLIQASRLRGWQAFRDLTLRAVEISLSEHLLSSSSLPYDDFIQNITLRVVLVSVLGVERDIQDFDNSDVTLVAHYITELWSLSKLGGPASPGVLHDLNARLRRLVPDEDAFPNPLDYVIPAWETLWRVVAAAVAHSHDDERIRQVFGNLCAHPSETQYREGSEITGNLSAKFVIDETMRLYPPSRHISRTVRVSRLPVWLASWLPSSIIHLVEHLSPAALRPTTKEYADISSVLGSASIWGNTCGEFDARRHHSSQVLPGQAEMLTLAFGYGPLRCVASSWAPMAMAVICSAILEHVDCHKFKIISGQNVGGRGKWVGWSVEKSDGHDHHYELSSHS